MPALSTGGHMKTRVLFVDDEPLVLQGLQRMLRSMRHEWDMTFVESGAQALERLRQEPFDVVISDMRMPGMNGAELLGAVTKKFPKTVRLIFSGQADQDLVLKSIGSAHQYLSKPCDPDTIKTTVARTIGLEAALRSQALQQLVSQMDCLPSIPTLYSRIVQKLQDPEVGVDEVAEIVAQDLGMTATILKVVNSAFFGLGQRISSPHEAVAYLGLQTVKSLVLCMGALSKFEEVSLGGFSLETLWSHSLATAGAAKRIVEIESQDRKLIDEAFVAGMLHDIGKLLLAATLPKEFGEILQRADSEKLSLVEVETEAFGANHAEVGAYLMGLWGLPGPVVEAIGYHHAPAKAGVQSFSCLTAVHTPNAFVQETGAGNSGRQTDEGYLQGLGVVERLPVWRQACAA
jgi:HD-like signal output (HDOD) protein